MPKPIISAGKTAFRGGQTNINLVTGIFLGRPGTWTKSQILLAQLAFVGVRPARMAEKPLPSLPIAFSEKVNFVDRRQDEKARFVAGSNGGKLAIVCKSASMREVSKNQVNSPPGPGQPLPLIRNHWHVG